MIVDADMGMPIDLSQYDGLWDYDANDGEDYGTSCFTHIDIINFCS